MRFVYVFAAAAVVASFAAPEGAAAQAASWSPPTREMPMMPLAQELSGNWLQPRSAWFGGVEQISGVAPASLRPSGDRRSGSNHLQIARFGRGAVPVVVWSDRNGDDRADMIEIFRTGGIIIQLIDADYDGQANVMRVYDGSGTLLREDRL